MNAASFSTSRMNSASLWARCQPPAGPRAHGPHLDVGDLVDEGRDGLAASAHSGAVDQVACRADIRPPRGRVPHDTGPRTAVTEAHAADHDALLRSDDVQAGAGAAQHAGHVIEHVVTALLSLEQLDIRVEQVSLGHMDARDGQVVHDLQNAGHNGGFPARIAMSTNPTF
jgi:hypothetical protein